MTPIAETMRAKDHPDDREEGARGLEASKPATVAVSYLQALFDYLRLRGRDPDEVLGSSGLAGSETRDQRVTEAHAAKLFNRAAQALQDDALGLHVGEHIRPGHYGVLGYVAMACDTLGEAMQAQQRYQGLVLSIPPAQVTLEADAIIYSWRPETDASYRHLAEFNFAALLTYVRWVTDRPLVPVRVDVTYPRPERQDEHARILGCPMRFDQAVYRLGIPFEWDGLPLVQPDAAMRVLMDRLARQQLLALDQEGDIVDQSRSLIARRLGAGEVTLELIAAELQVSPRSLQRQLQSRGSGFSALLDQVRCELAERYLADQEMGLTDIAFLLGYSEQSAFTRAYRRWTGASPMQRRESLRDGTRKDG